MGHGKPIDVLFDKRSPLGSIGGENQEKKNTPKYEKRR